MTTTPAVKPPTKKQQKTIHKLALGTISEIDRRGWFQGALAETLVKDLNMKCDCGDKGCAEPGVKEIDEEVARVCLVGAASSAFNPFHPHFPGANMLGATGDYRMFLYAVADALPKTAKARHLRDGAFRNDFAAISAIAAWNDDDKRTVNQVKALLRKVAEKHAPAPKVVAAA